jgi:zinc transport system permease protein
MDLMEIFSYGFMQRALLGGILIGMPCAVLGVFLVLRRLSLIGDGLAHVTFGGVAVALLLRVTPPLVTLAAIPLVLAASLGILRLADRARIYGDTAIGIVSAAGIAGGILIASVAGGFNVDLFSYLFGNILAVSPAELALCAGLFLVVLAVVIAFYPQLFALTFDEELARTAGIRTERLNALLVLLTAVAVVLAMKVVGILLVSALLILPAATALQLARGFRTTLLAAALTAAASVAAGIVASFLVNLPSGATIVLVNLGLFLLAFALKSLRSAPTPR